MDRKIKQIEDLSLNAWPSHKMQLYDGWILRFSYFYTHRTNCVEQFGEETLPWNVKIPYCESEYQRLGSPAIFKISPLVSPNFDFMLENRGYHTEHTTNVLTMDLADLSLSDPEGSSSPILDDPAFSMNLSETISTEWIEALFSLKKMTNPIHRQVVPSMYQAIPKETLCVSIRKDQAIVATGLGILDRDFIGIYAIHVREDLRRLGLARKICKQLLFEGEKKGANKAYLQVVDGNVPARNLYESFGFKHFYTYWFRVQP